MKFQEIAGLSAAELRQRIIKGRRDLFDARMLLSQKRLANPLSIRFLRKDIARLMTALGGREKEAAAGEKALSPGYAPPRASAKAAPQGSSPQPQSAAAAAGKAMMKPDFQAAKSEPSDRLAGKAKRLKEAQTENTKK